MDKKSLSHTARKCQYHIIFIPKYRKKKLYSQVRSDIRDIIKTLCSYKNVEIVEGAVCVDHIHLCVRETRGIILHSDLGSQYTSQSFEKFLNSREIRHSFSRKGNPYDNACIESFHSVLKKEEIYLHTYQDSKEARRAIFEYIEGRYNRKRIHSAIGYMTPQQKEDEELKKAA